MARVPEIKRGRTFVFPIYRRAADKVTPVDWPPGVLTSQIRSGSPAGSLVAGLG